MYKRLFQKLSDFKKFTMTLSKNLQSAFFCTNAIESSLCDIVLSIFRYFQHFHSNNAQKNHIKSRKNEKPVKKNSKTIFKIANLLLLKTENLYYGIYISEATD